MQRPSVSVVIPCYNVALFVSGAIESALNQTYPIDEVICVDDGSDDGTLSIVQTLAREHPERVTVLSGPNRGACHARNRGLRIASGSYIQFLDADDTIEPHKIEHQVDLLDRTGFKADLVVGAYVLNGPDGKKTHVSRRGASHYLNLILGNMGITSSNLWRREPVLSCGGWNEQLIGSQEVELMYRMVSAGSEAIFDEEPLTHVRVRQDSLSRAPEKRARYAANFVSLRGAMFEKMREETSMEKDREEDALNYVFRWIRELYKYDPEQAVDLHDQVIPQWFTPAGSGVMGNIFSIAYRTLGYSRAERLKRRLGRS